jgi:hypothetical protein
MAKFLGFYALCYFSFLSREVGSFELEVLCFSLEYWCSKFEFLLFSCFYDHIEGVKCNSLIWIYRSLLHCYFLRCLINDEFAPCLFSFLTCVCPQNE